MLVVGSLVAKSCLTLVTHGLSPARLLCPWDSPGKNTGVGCHFLFLGKMLVGDKTTFKYICRNWPFLPMNFKVKESIRWSVVSNSLQPHGLWPARLHCPWNFPSKKTGVGCHYQEFCMWRTGSSRCQPQAQWKLIHKSMNIALTQHLAEF